MARKTSFRATARREREKAKEQVEGKGGRGNFTER